MKKYLVDTNVFLRFILKDNEKHYFSAEKLFKDANEQKIQLLVLTEVVIEVSYILIKVYKNSKNDTINILQTLIESPLFELENISKDLMLLALKVYLNNNVDLVDSILFAYSYLGSTEIFSFDKDFKKIRID